MAAEDITDIFTGMPVDNGGLPGDRDQMTPWGELDARAKSMNVGDLEGIVVAASGVFVTGCLANILSTTLVDGITRDRFETIPGDSK